TFFFVYIGLSIELTNWWLLLTGFALTVMAFVIRVPVVRVTTSRETPQLDASLMAVTIPKGLAAAALASLPAQQGVPFGELLQGVAYGVILFTIVVSAALSFLVERRGAVGPYRMVFARYAAGGEPGL
ncbi:MAG: cation:proton antiporter, partial [Acidobacteria bacterium]|nr:cation:proton antiporter [Acidobacteriota bacterium]